MMLIFVLAIETRRRISSTPNPADLLSQAKHTLPDEASPEEEVTAPELTSNPVTNTSEATIISNDQRVSSTPNPVDLLSQSKPNESSSEEEVTAPELTSNDSSSPANLSNRSCSPAALLAASNSFDLSALSAHPLNNSPSVPGTGAADALATFDFPLNTSSVLISPSAPGTGAADALATFDFPLNTSSVSISPSAPGTGAADAATFDFSSLSALPSNLSSNTNPQCVTPQNAQWIFPQPGGDVQNSPLSRFMAQTDPVNNWNAVSTNLGMGMMTDPIDWGNGNQLTPDYTTYFTELPFYPTSSAAGYNAYDSTAFKSLAEATPSTFPCGNSQSVNTLPLPTTTNLEVDDTPDDTPDDDGTKKRKRTREDEENAALVLPEGSRRAHKPRRLPDGESVAPLSKRSRKK
jgi:hypothetical protein